MVELVKVFTDNYEVLYVNGYSLFEESELNLNEVLFYLIGKEVKSYKILYIKPEIIDEFYDGVLPMTLSDIKLEHLC